MTMKKGSGGTNVNTRKMLDQLEPRPTPAPTPAPQPADPMAATPDQKPAPLRNIFEGFGQ